MFYWNYRLILQLLRIELVVCPERALHIICSIMMPTFSVITQMTVTEKWAGCHLGRLQKDEIIYDVIAAAVADSPDVWKTASPTLVTCRSAKPQRLEKKHQEPPYLSQPEPSSLQSNKPLSGRLTPRSPPIGFEPVIIECNEGLIS